MFFQLAHNAHRIKRLWRFRLVRVNGGIGFLPLKVGNSYEFWPPRRELLKMPHSLYALLSVVRSPVWFSPSGWLDYWAFSRGGRCR